MQPARTRRALRLRCARGAAVRYTTARVSTTGLFRRSHHAGQAQREGDGGDRVDDQRPPDELGEHGAVAARRAVLCIARRPAQPAHDPPDACRAARRASRRCSGGVAHARARNARAPRRCDRRLSVCTLQRLAGSARARNAPESVTRYGWRTPPMRETARYVGNVSSACAGVGPRQHCARPSRRPLCCRAPAGARAARS